VVKIIAGLFALLAVSQTLRSRRPRISMLGFPAETERAPAIASGSFCAAKLLQAILVERLLACETD
jgi:hypothetical protein